MPCLAMPCHAITDQTIPYQYTVLCIFLVQLLPASATRDGCNRSVEGHLAFEILLDEDPLLMEEQRDLASKGIRTAIGT